MKGIPEFMHRTYRYEGGDNEEYVCGLKVHSWSEKWLNSHSDICERDGKNVYRFTAGTDVAYLSLCSQCWKDEPFKIPSPKPTVFGELNQPQSEVESENAIYLWDFITI